MVHNYFSSTEVYNRTNELKLLALKEPRVQGICLFHAVIWLKVRLSVRVYCSRNLQLRNVFCFVVSEDEDVEGGVQG